MILPASYANGFAPRDGMPLYPELWRGCVFAAAPCLGPSGLTLRDWSGRGNHGTLTGGPTWGPAHGKYAVTFDGSDDYVNLTNDAPIPSGRFTIMHWVRPASLGTLQIPFSQGRIGGGGTYITTRLTSTSKFETAIDGANVDTGTTTLQNDVWYALAASYDGTTSRVYVSGILEKSASRTANYTNGEARIGSGFTNTGVTSLVLNGSISDMMIFNTALSENLIRLYSTRPGIAYEMAPRRRSRAVVITSGFSALRPSILRGAR